MNKRIVESFSMEEAFKALNKKSVKKLVESIAETIVEIPGSKVVYPEFFADEVDDYRGGDLKFAKVHKYYIDKGTPREDLIVTKMFATSDWVDAAEEHDDYSIIEICGYQLANGDYLYCDASTQAGDLFIKCKNYESMEHHLLNRNAGSLYPDGEFVEESLANKTKPQRKVVEAAGQLTDTVIKSALNHYISEFEPIDNQVSFDGFVETVAGDLYAKYIYGGDFSGAFLSAEEEAELADLETRVQIAANELLGTNYTLRSHVNEATNKVFEAVDDDIVEVSADLVGYPGFFADEIENLYDEYDDEDEYDEDMEGTVANYYITQNTPRADLIVKKYFIIDPKRMKDEDGNPWDISIKDYFENGFAEEFGFQIANGDYLYTRACHDVGPAYVKCKSYESMCNYVTHGYMSNKWNVSDLVED